MLFSRTFNCVSLHQQELAQLLEINLLIQMDWSGCYTTLEQSSKWILNLNKVWGLSGTPTCIAMANKSSGWNHDSCSAWIATHFCGMSPWQLNKLCPLIQVVWCGWKARKCILSLGYSQTAICKLKKNYYLNNKFSTLGLCLLYEIKHSQQNVRI